MNMMSDRRGTIAIMTATMAPAMLMLGALMVDGGFWIVGSTQLQIAADAAAMGAGQLLSSNLKSQSSVNQQANLTAAAAFEAGNAAPKFLGAINATVTAAADFSYVTVKLTSQAPGYLNNLTSLFPPFTAVAPPLLSATATVSLKGGPRPCVLTLGASGTDIEVDNSGVVAATSCPIFSNSNSSPSIHAAGSGQISESGAISGSDIAAMGTIASDNGGSITATTISPNQAKAATDPLAGTPAPTPGTCSGGQSDFTDNHNGQPYVITPQTWCNVNVTLGGNSNTIQLQPGVYYVVNGNLTFNNASVTLNAGVSFVLAGTNPGSFSWTNYSNTANPITAATTGPSAGIAIWMTCNSSGNQTATFNGGSTLNINGTIYVPCTAVTINNYAQVNAPLGQNFSLISKTLTVSGSGGLRTAASGAGSSTNAGAVLTQ